MRVDANYVLHKEAKNINHSKTGLITSTATALLAHLDVENPLSLHCERRFLWIDTMDESMDSAVEYFKQSMNYQLKYYETLIAKIPFTDKDHVFDLGCGTAAMSARMAKEIVPKGQVTACDPEESRIRLAIEKFSDIPNLHIMHATGSTALDNKADVYDVIVSNGVLHWMTEDELRKTMVNMFNALKRGGIAAHNFAEDLANTYYTLQTIDESKVRGMLQIFHPIKKDMFTNLAKEIGFVVVYSESFIYKTEFDTVGDLLKTADATTYGLFGWEKLYNDAKSRGLQVEFDVSDAGRPLETVQLDNFVLKKP